MKPDTIEIHVGYTHPLDDDLVCWAPNRAMNRTEAARALWEARWDRLDINRTLTGYTITGASNPAWVYARDAT